MQRIGRSEPLSPLGKWMLAGWFLVALLAIVRHTAGGWRGLLHHRLRGPLAATIASALLAGGGKWLSDQHLTGLVSERVAGIGGVLMLCGMIACIPAVVVSYTRILSRWEDAAEITRELTDLLDGERQLFHVEGVDAYRPLELLEELTELIGPGGWAPGHPWATQQWIADRIPAALAAKSGPR